MKTKLFNIVAAYGVMILWTIFITNFYTAIHVSQFYRPVDNVYMFFTSCVIAPIWEEAAFRFGPLEVIRGNDKFLLPVVVMSSVLFGWLHGGPSHIMIQGVFGVIFCWLYIKNGYSYVSSVILHSLWNTSMIWGLKFL